MKNIHILPTDKPSRLLFDKEENKLLPLQEVDFWMEHQNLMENQNIYITDDSEIKGVKWIIHDGKIHEVTKNKGLYISVKDLRHIDIRADLCKKIILTTDQDLIKDGVQAIDDTFLEWFVKNPSCEWVGVKKVFDEDWSEISGAFEISYYKIIIPKEELKKLTDLEIAIKLEEIEKEEPKQKNRKVCKCKRAYENPLSGICSLCWNELYPDEKDEIKDEDLLEPKQETLEETAKRLHPEEWDWREREIFIKGAKWQQERMYSEEEVYSLLEQSMKDCHLWELEEHYSGDYKNLKEWFEQFKKKQ